MRTFGSDKSSNTGWFYDLNTGPADVYGSNSALDSYRYFQSGLDAVSGSSGVYQDADGNWVDDRPGAGSLLGIITGANSFSNDNDNDLIPPNTGNNIASSTPQQIQYFDAPYAEMYGMSAETAYQEALANTAYRRKVADLKAAGLNPVLGISGTGAASFGGSLPSYGSSGSGRSTSDMSDFLGKLSYGLPTFVNGLVNLAVTLKTGNGMSGFGAGMIAQNITQGALNLSKNFSK